MAFRQKLIMSSDMPSRSFLNDARSKGKCGQSHVLRRDLDTRSWSRQRCQSCQRTFGSLLAAYEREGLWSDAEAPDSSTAMRELPRTRAAHSRDSYTLFNHWKELDRSAKDGCAICRIVRQHLLQLQTLKILENSTETVRIIRSARGSRMPSLFPPLISVEMGSLFSILLEIHPVPREDHFQAGLTYTKPSPLFLRCRGHDTDTSSASQTDRIDCIRDCVRFWLDECSKMHKSCRRNNVVQPIRTKANSSSVDRLTTVDRDIFIPTRLLSISRTTSGMIGVKLVERSKLERNGRTSLRFGSSERPLLYSALSYSWGPGGEFSKTSRANYAERCQGIDYEKLAKTFKDAIQFSLAMDVPYIWIDTFCIIQATDNDRYYDDWNHEVKMMPEIYRNAIITIAAASAPSVHDGCIFPHPDREYAVTPHNVADLLSPTNTIKGSLFIQPQLAEWTTLVTASHLASRGWCLQERILSTRTVFFTTHGIFWECQELEASEHCPVAAQYFSRTASEAMKTRFAVVKKFPFISRHSYLSPKREESPHLKADASSNMWRSLSEDDLTAKGWLLLVENLSRRNFTRTEDKLDAIVGVAKVIYKIIQGQDDYLAGLWRSSIHRGLSWAAIIPEERLSDPKQARVKIPGRPSWSWASIQNEVSYFFANERNPYTDFNGDLAWTSLVTFQGAKNLASNPADQVSNIAQAALLLRGKLTNFKSPFFLFASSPDMSLRALHAKHDEGSSSPCQNMFRIDEAHKLYIDDLETYNRIQSEDPRELPFILLGVLTRKILRHGWVEEANDPEEQGLLVLQAVDKATQPNTYRRIGWLERGLYAWASRELPILEESERFWEPILNEGVEADVILI